MSAEDVLEAFDLVGRCGELEVECVLPGDEGRGDSAFGEATPLCRRTPTPLRNKFLVLQESLFADFSAVNTELLGISAVLVIAAALYGGNQLRRLDVVALGRDHALNLGVDHRAVVNRALLVVAVLVSVSTALVGPITFLGLLDEPLNNLDMRHSVHMMRRLRRMAEQFDKSIVLVVHDINFASCHSDHIITMKSGAVHSQGDVDATMTPEVLREVYSLEVDVHDIGGQRIGVYFS